MRKLFLGFLLLILNIGYSQQNHFNDNLKKSCLQAIKDSSEITKERKVIMDKIAEELYKKKYILFTCQTNSRRTLLLQAWAQTSFIYYGLYHTFAFSIGDTVTQAHPDVANVLKESGFTCNKLTDENSNGYIISISEELPINILLSKDHLGTIDTTKGVVVSICYEGEHSHIASTVKHINLPYQSPLAFENTPEEKKKYTELNKQIAAEMFYLAQRTKELIVKNAQPSK
jgi:hypothetical protein